MKRLSFFVFILGMTVSGYAISSPPIFEFNGSRLGDSVAMFKKQNLHFDCGVMTKGEVGCSKIAGPRYRQVFTSNVHANFKKGRLNNLYADLGISNQDPFLLSKFVDDLKKKYGAPIKDEDKKLDYDYRYKRDTLWRGKDGSELNIYIYHNNGGGSFPAEYSGHFSLKAQ